MRIEWITPADLPQLADTPLYGTRPWLECIAEVSPLPLRILALVDEGKITAWHPFLESVRGPLRRALPLWVQTTSGPYYAMPAGLPFFEHSRWLRNMQSEMFAALASHVHFATLFPYESDPRNLAQGWSTSVRATARLDLQMVPFAFSKQAQGKLHRAENKDLSFVKNSSPQNIVQAIESVHAKHHIRNFLSAENVNQLRLLFEKRNLVETWCVLDAGGQEVAYGAIALDKTCDSVRLWHNLHSEAAYKLYAADFMIGKIAEAYRGTFRWFDLCGTDLPNLIEFKEKWATETQYSFAHEFVRNQPLNLALKAFATIRKLK